MITALSNLLLQFDEIHGYHPMFHPFECGACQFKTLREKVIRQKFKALHALVFRFHMRHAPQSIGGVVC